MASGNDGGTGRQFLADILNLTVEHPVNTESTVLGVALLAGLAAGVFESLDALAATWQSDAVFEPHMDELRREALYRGWRDAVGRVRTAGERDS